MIKRDCIDKIRKLWFLFVRKSFDLRFDWLLKFVRIEDELWLCFLYLLNCLVFLKKIKEVNGVLILNNVCEGKYKLMVINIEEIIEKSGFSRYGVIFFRDMKVNCVLLFMLGGDLKVRKDCIKEKLFCDILLNILCFSILWGLMIFL